MRVKRKSYKIEEDGKTRLALCTIFKFAYINCEFISLFLYILKVREHSFHVMLRTCVVNLLVNRHI